MFAKDPAKQYHRAVKDLDAAEKAFQAAMDAVQQARDSEQWDSVPTLRKRCVASEHALEAALAAAQQAHEAFWRSRAASEIPNLRAAAMTLRRYGRMVRACGDNEAMARGTFDAFEFKPEELDPSEDVPVESPDSELVWFQHDPSWKPRY